MTDLSYYLNPEEVPDYLETESANRLRYANDLNRMIAESGNYRLGHENGNTTVWDRSNHDHYGPIQVSVSRCYDRVLVETW